MLTHLYQIDPTDIEILDPVRQRPTYKRKFATEIARSREELLENDTDSPATIKIYTDGSGYKGNAGAAAVLMREARPPITLKYHLGPLTRNTTYEAEAVAVTLGLQLLLKEQLPKDIRLSLDNQGVIMASASRKQRKSQYILDAIHKMTVKQSNRERSIPGYSLTIAWISGHSGAVGNKLVNKEAKKAATGESDDLSVLPPFIRKLNGRLPASTSALKQAFSKELRDRWKARWLDSPRREKLKKFTEDFPLTNSRWVMRGLSRAQTSLILQIKSGHIQLNLHLHRMKKIDSSKCPECGTADENVHHFIFDCPAYINKRLDLLAQTKKLDYVTLFETRDGIKATLDYIHETRRFRKIYGDVWAKNLLDNSDDIPHPTDLYGDAIEEED